MHPTKFLRARNGAVFPSSVEVEPDGSLVIISADGKGYRSAHRDEAQKHFGKALWCMNRLSWINLDGVRVVLTRWQTQEFRTSTPAAMERFYAQEDAR